MVIGGKHGEKRGREGRRVSDGACFMGATSCLCEDMFLLSKFSSTSCIISISQNLDFLHALWFFVVEVFLQCLALVDDGALRSLLEALSVAIACQLVGFSAFPWGPAINVCRSFGVQGAGGRPFLQRNPPPIA